LKGEGMELDDNKIEKLMQASVNMRDKIENLEKEITDIICLDIIPLINTLSAHAVAGFELGMGVLEDDQKKLTKRIDEIKRLSDLLGYETNLEKWIPIHHPK
jgi:hypothetical protein